MNQLLESVTVCCYLVVLAEDNTKMVSATVATPRNPFCCWKYKQLWVLSAKAHLITTTPTFLGYPNVFQFFGGNVRDEIDVIVASIYQLLLVLCELQQSQPGWYVGLDTR